jgi:hypothetical protein
MPSGLLDRVGSEISSESTPAVVTRPIKLPAGSVNHSAPSEPETMSDAALAIGYSVIAPNRPGSRPM